MKKEKKLTIVTIRSNDLGSKTLKSFKKELRKGLPKNHKIAIVVLGNDAGLNVNTINI